MKAPKKIELTKEQLFNLAPKYIADTAVMTLRGFNTVYLIHEWYQWYCCTCIPDRKIDESATIYIIKDSAVYTQKERWLNYINVFRDYPVTHEIRRNYGELRAAVRAGKRRWIFPGWGMLYGHRPEAPGRQGRLIFRGFLPVRLGIERFVRPELRF